MRAFPIIKNIIIIKYIIQKIVIMNLTRDLNYLRHSAAFAKVAALGSFRAAANALHISPPLMSQLISELEEHLGTQLLYRSTRQLQLTPAGRDYLEGVMRMLQAYEESLDLVREKNEASGEIRISLPTIFENASFARFYRGFIDKFPKARPILEFADSFQDPSEKGHDLSFRVGWPHDDTRAARKLFESEAWLVGAASMTRKIHHPKDLEDENWFVPHQDMPALRMSHNDGESYVLNSQKLRPMNSSTLPGQLVRMGAGFMIVPQFAVRDEIQSGQMVRLLPDWHFEPLGVYALYSARRARLSNARIFVEEFDAFLRDMRA